MTKSSEKIAPVLLSAMLLFGAAVPAYGKESQLSDLDLSSNASQQVQSDFISTLPLKQEYASDHVIVKYRSDSAAASLATSLSSQITETSPLTVPHAQLLKLKAGADVQSVIQELQKDPNVIYAEPDYKVSSGLNPQAFRPVDRTTLTSVSAAGAQGEPELPNDPLFNEQWALHNTGQELNGGAVPGGPPDIDMDLPEAWEITKGSRDVTVAVIGSGVKIDVPDLEGQIWTNSKEIPGNNIDDDGNGLVDDVNGWDFAHGDNTLFDTIDGLNDVYGTTVAGQIAAAMNNEEGIAGVAPNVNVMPLKVTSEQGGYFSDVVKAIHYAEEQGVKIAMLGLVYTYKSKLVQDAIEASDMLFVAPAGDSNQGVLNTDVLPVYPAAYPSSNVLSVTGVNLFGNLSLGAARGAASVDVAAPSELIISTVPDVNAGYSAQIDNGTYKAYYNGIGFEEIPVDMPEYAGQRQDMFDRAMNYLKPSDGTAPRILLVNDSRRISEGGIGPFYESDVLGVYQELLDQAGYTYDLVETQDETFNGPLLEQLQQYNVVVWFTGTAATFNNAKLLTDVDKDNLTSYLNGGGHLMLTGQDAIDQSLNSPFVLDVLGLKLVKEGGYIFKGWGVPGTIYEDQIYKLMDVSLYYDTVISNKPEMTTINLKNSVGNYSYSQGTLYAAAYAAGVAALVESQNSEMSVPDIKQRVMTSGKTLSDLITTTVSGKMISAYRALWNKDIPGMSLIDPTVTGRLDQVNDPNHVYSVELTAGEEVTFSLTGAADTDFDLILYDSSATTVQSKDNAIAFSETAGKSSESIKYRASKTGTFYINVHAVSGAGSYTLTVQHSNSSGLLEENDPSLSYEGNWATLSGNSYSNGSLKQLTGDGSVQFGFRGNVFEWIGTKNDAQGIGEIWIDGFIAGYADLYSKNPQSKQSLFKIVLPNGHHDVVIRSSGGGGQKKSINVDSFVVSSLISPLHASADYVGPWANRYGKKYPDGVQSYTTTPGSSAEFTFTGTKVTLWSTTGSNRGKVNIYIDGKSVTPSPIDLYSEELHYLVPVFSSGELSNSEHKIRIVHAGEANPKSSNSIVSIDGFDVQNLR